MKKGLFMAQKKTKRPRKGLRMILAALALIALVHGADALINGGNIEYAEFAFESERVPAELDGYVLAFVSDLHSISEQDLAAVAARISARGADVLLLGGDYAPDGRVAMNMRVLGAIRPPGGAYGVEGNHDKWRGISAVMRENGITPLGNEGVRTREGLYIAGVRDLWVGGPDVDDALSGKMDGDFAVLISHNPDVAMRYDMTDADLTVSGHTHGGQIALFGFWRPALAHVSDYGGLFKGGFVQTPSGANVLVSRGTGNFPIIPRAFSRPEVIFITLKRG